MAGRILPKRVEILHDLDAQVVCEGIENLEQWHIAQAAGVDLVQGFFFARPQAELHEARKLNLARQAPAPHASKRPPAIPAACA